MEKTDLAATIIHLCVTPGIDRREDPELFHACLDNMDAVNRHMAVVGMRLIIDIHLGVISAISFEEEESAPDRDATNVARLRLAPRAWTAECWVSVIIALLVVRYQRAPADPGAAWIGEEELFAELVSRMSAADREGSATLRWKLAVVLDALKRRRFLATRRGRTRQVSATHWLVRCMGWRPRRHKGRREGRGLAHSLLS